MTMEDLSITHKIVGYFAHSKKGYAFCDGDACIISGTEALMFMATTSY